MSTADNKNRFSLSRMMIGMLFVSLLMGATFVQSEFVFAFCTFAIVALVAWFCIDSKCRPGPSGALIGFTTPALMSLHLIGELYAPTQPGEFVDTEYNIPIAIMTLVFIGGACAWLGGLVGMVFGIVKDRFTG